MKFSSFAILASFTASLHFVASAQNVEELRVGQVIGNENGQVVNGWQQQGGGYYLRRTTQNYVTQEISECCVTVFTRGNIYLFAATEPIARSERGGVEAERVKAIWKLTINDDEQPVDCNLMWIKPSASFSTGPGKAIRSVIYDGDDFTLISWFDPGNYCGYGD